MSFEPTEDWRYCPTCGSSEIEVDESRDDYYLGPIYRCTSGHGFYASPGDPVPIHYTEPPPGSVAASVNTLMRVAFAGSAEETRRAYGESLLVKELARPVSDEAVVRVPLISGPPPPRRFRFLTWPWRKLRGRA